MAVTYYTYAIPTGYREDDLRLKITAAGLADPLFVYVDPYNNNLIVVYDPALSASNQATLTSLVAVYVVGTYYPPPINAPLLWTPYKLTFADFAGLGAGNDKSVQIADYAALTFVHNYAFTYDQWSGGTIIGMLAGVGYVASGSPTGTGLEFINTQDVFTNPASASYDFGGYHQGYLVSDRSSANTFPLATGDARGVRVRLVSTGDDVSAATAGSVTVWLQTSNLPTP